MDEKYTAEELVTRLKQAFYDGFNIEFAQVTNPFFYHYSIPALTKAE